MGWVSGRPILATIQRQCDQSKVKPSAVAAVDAVWRAHARRLQVLAALAEEWQRVEGPNWASRLLKGMVSCITASRHQSISQQDNLIPRLRPDVSQISCYVTDQKPSALSPQNLLSGMLTADEPWSP